MNRKGMRVPFLQLGWLALAGPLLLSGCSLEAADIGTGQQTCTPVDAAPPVDAPVEVPDAAALPYQGCTPGFWQGGSDRSFAGGRWLWNDADDPTWTLSGGMGANPYVWTTLFNDYFTPSAALDGLTMMDLVGTGGGSVSARKAARSLVAAYLNASWGMSFPYSPSQLSAMWTEAVASGDYHLLHMELDAANNARYDGAEGCPISARPEAGPSATRVLHPR